MTMKYTCKECKKKFEVKNKLAYFNWLIVTFGSGKFYCDKCFKKLKGGN